MRLIRIKDELNGHIDCELATFDLDDKPQYTALSYCWTRDEPSCMIKINGVDFLVRPHLFTFLQLMAEEQCNDWFFIDAICFNQDDRRREPTRCVSCAMSIGTPRR